MKNACKVGVCTGRIDVAEVGRQQWEPVPRLPATSIPVKDGIDGESVPKVMESRPARSRARLEAGAVDELAKGGLDTHVVQPGANR